jgi:hypothetical protein
MVSTSFRQGIIDYVVYTDFIAMQLRYYIAFAHDDYTRVFRALRQLDQFLVIAGKHQHGRTVFSHFAKYFVYIPPGLYVYPFGGIIRKQQTGIGGCPPAHYNFLLVSA